MYKNKLTKSSITKNSHKSVTTQYCIIVNIKDITFIKHNKVQWHLAESQKLENIIILAYYRKPNHIMLRNWIKVNYTELNLQ